MYTHNPDSTSTNADSPFIQLAERRIAAQQAQLDRARQLIERYHQTQDLNGLTQLQQELLAILGHQDDHDPDNNMVTAAWLTGSLYHECRIVVDTELICRLLNRFHLGPPSTTREIQECDKGGRHVDFP